MMIHQQHCSLVRTMLFWVSMRDRARARGRRGKTGQGLGSRISNISFVSLLSQ